MERNRRNKKHSNWNNQKNNQHNSHNNQHNQHKEHNNSYNKNQELHVKKFEFNHTNYEDPNQQKDKEKAIKEIKEREVICSKCGLAISDITSCLSDKGNNSPIHFDCAIKEVEAGEKLLPNEKIAYIGQGRFGILSYENIRDQRHFTIKKIIEWENRENKLEWRDEISNLYSKIN